MNFTGSHSPSIRHFFSNGKGSLRLHTGNDALHLSHMRGTLIVLEGTDGSGKSTQFQLLLARFKKTHRPLATFKFPQYGKKSAGLVEEYLAGNYGKNPEDVSPYVASLFYALDRFDAAAKIRRLLENGKTVLLDRYVDSNAGHQGGKIKSPAARKKFLRWLYDMEYRMLGIPKPDIVIILHAPASMNAVLLAHKKRDIHERSARHLKDTERAYLWLAANYHKNHRVIACAPQGKLLPPHKVHEKIWRIVEPLVTLTKK